MDIEQCFKKIYDIKISGKKVYTNCTKNINELKDSRIICDEYSIIILKEKYEGANRAYFYSWNIDNLNESLKECPKDSILEIVTKNENDYKEQILNAGFDCVAKMMKVSNNNIGHIFENELVKVDNNVAKKASMEDLDDIYKILYETFCSYISHLPTKSELIEKIENKEFVLIKNQQGKIISLLQQIVKQQSYYFNQIINTGNKKLFHEMVKNELHKYYLNGGNQVYAWVAEDNIASLRFFEKYGLKDVGLRNVIYMKS